MKNFKYLRHIVTDDPKGNMHGGWEQRALSLRSNMIESKFLFSNFGFSLCEKCRAN